MYTGIIQHCLVVSKFKQMGPLAHLYLPNDPHFFIDVALGASVGVSGVCLTVAEISTDTIRFDLMTETIERSNLGLITVGAHVNVERSARFGDEIGGHYVSGHVDTTVIVQRLEMPHPEQWIFTLKTTPDWIRYLFPKGFVALDGASLTVVAVDTYACVFTVHLIPETIKRTTFQFRKCNDRINMEVDKQTQTIVDTMTRLLSQREIANNN